MAVVKSLTSRTDRSGRAAVAVAAMVALSTTTAVALTADTAAAQEAGRCTVNVNVRAEPDVSAQIVALCEAGTVVRLGERRDGFVQLVDLGGWASQAYIGVGDGPAPAEPVTTPGGPDVGSGGRSAAGSSGR